MANSGRWVKMTKQSAQLLSKHRSTSIGKDGLLAGVIRGDKGRILKHLKFEDLGSVGLLTPAAPAVLAPLATQYALEAALDEITSYLEQIDFKLDQLLKQRKTETLGQIGGVTLAIEEAYAIYRETETVSAVTWSKVQATSLALQTMQAESVSQLHALAEGVSAVASDVDKTAKLLGTTKGDVRFWLGVLARTIALQDQEYILELVRVAEEDARQLDGHRRGITVARMERVTRIVAGLDAMVAAIAPVAELSNATRVINPINAPRVTDLVAQIQAEIVSFAERAEIELEQFVAIESTTWGRAARGLFNESISAVASAGSGVVGQARAAGHAFGERREEGILRKARQIEERRRTPEDQER